MSVRGNKNVRAFFTSTFTFKTSMVDTPYILAWIEAPLITREVLPKTYFLLVITAADAQARPFLQFQASCLQPYVEPCKCFDFSGSFFDF
jgi:hypothetical protein